MNLSPKPLFRGRLHQSMFFVTLGACLMLISMASTPAETLATAVYSVGACLMFGASAAYHRFQWGPRWNRFMRTFDHSAIYLMIAGTMTPIAALALPPASSLKLLLIAWSVAAIGILKSIFFPNVHRLLNIGVYIFAGYTMVPYLRELSPAIGRFNVGLMVAGALIYIVGALCYGFKTPKLNPRIFGYHEVFHVFVCGGALCHFLVIYSVVQQVS